MPHTGQIFVIQKCVTDGVSDVDDGVSGLSALVSDGDLGGGRIRLVVMNQWMNKLRNMWISIRTKNFETSRIHLSWFVLHGGDDGGVVLIRGLKKLVWCSVR